jgi:hypothetical protein
MWLSGPAPSAENATGSSPLFDLTARRDTSTVRSFPLSSFPAGRFCSFLIFLQGVAVQFNVQAPVFVEEANRVAHLSGSESGRRFRALPPRGQVNEEARKPSISRDFRASRQG